MGLLVCGGAQLTCTFGMAPSVLTVLPQKKVLCAMPAATIMDKAPMVNILPFGMCVSPSNPTVAAATAAALGVLTPMPCIPALSAPWAPGSTSILIGGTPALENMSKCICNWGGVIQVVNPGQTKVVLGK